MEQTITSPKTGTGIHETSDTGWRPILAAVFRFLATVWQKIRSGLWSVSDRLRSDIAKPLDIDRITAHLAVLKRAEAEGRNNLPPSIEEVPSGTQREIIAYFTNLRRRARHQVAETADKSSRILERINQSDILARLREVPAGCESKILRLIADAETHLDVTVEREQKQKRHYDAFREQNGLDRVASYPRAAYLFYLMLPVLIATSAFALASIVESSAGAGAGVPLAWIVTVSIAAAIVPFFLGGFFLRLTNHAGNFEMFLGLIGTIAAITAILGTAFYADFHIAAVLANPETSNRDVLDAMLAAPLEVVSGVASWKGFGLVALTGLVAMILAYRSDDPYPGYGAVQRSYYQARDARDHAATRLRKRINNLIDEAGAEIDTLSKDLKNQVRTYTSLVEKSKQFHAALTDYDAELEDTCNMVLDRYRVANTVARQSEVPMSFAEHVCFNPAGDADFGLLPDSNANVAELQTMTVALDKEAASARQNLRALNLRMINSISEPQFVDTE